MIRWTKLLVLGLIGTTVACSSAGGSSDTTVQPSTGDNGPDIESGPSVDETGDELATPMWFATADTATCPTGGTFDATSGFCTQGGRALGPFPAAMVTACKSGGGSSCDDANWDVAQATRFRGTDTCPTGASIDATLGVCTEGTNTFGPFSQTMVDDCTAAGGGDACSGLRFGKQLVSELPVEDNGDNTIVTQGAGTNCSQLNSKMAGFYGSRQGYDTVSRAGMRTLGTRHNGCATWLSHAIRMSGGNIPIEESTTGLRDALRSRGWTVIRDRADLQPGDVIITKDRAGQPGHPDHVYMFDGWDGRNPRAVDNQGAAHTRTSGRSPIAYGLRAPSGSSGGSCNQAANPPPAQSDASAPQRDSCGGKSDGWYCSEQESYSAYECKGADIVGGWQCSGNTVCRPNGSGQATLYGANPGCFGSK